MVKRSGARALAIAVFRQAIRDAAGVIEPHSYSRAIALSGMRGPMPMYGDDGEIVTKESIQQAALTWLTEPSESLAWWCELAEIDMSTVIDGAEGTIEKIWQRSRMKKPGAVEGG
ncbi:MAG: hypothetical protein AB7K36_30375 [Chloroflexota bacterium]